MTKFSRSLNHLYSHKHKYSEKKIGTDKKIKKDKSMKLLSLQREYGTPYFIIFIRSQKSVKIILEAIWYFPITYKSITADDTYSK